MNKTTTRQLVESHQECDFLVTADEKYVPEHGMKVIKCKQSEKSAIYKALKREVRHRGNRVFAL